jgi:hypothetical protein
MLPVCFLTGFMLCQLPSATKGGPAAVPLVKGLDNPTSVAVGGDGRVYVTAGSAVLALDKGKAVPFATGLDAPRGLAAYQKWLFVIDGRQVRRIGPDGKAEVFAAAGAFPAPGRALHDLAVDAESGILYVTAGGEGKDPDGAVYSVSPGRKVAVVTDGKRWPGLRRPGGLTLDGASFLLVLDDGTGELCRVRVSDGKAVKVAGGLGRGGGLA